MTTDRRARWTANGALSAALLALGLATWAAGCREREVPSERSAPVAAAPPAVAPAAVATAAAAQPAITPVSVAARAREPEPAPKAPIAADSLRVRRVVVTHAIDRREPVPGAELAAGDTPIYAFVELANSAADEQRVVVTFERGGSSVGHVKLRVPAESQRWRTWGQTRRIREAGQWDAVVRTEDGRELARTSFTVK